VALTDTSENIRQLLTLWENGILSRQDLIDLMPSVFSPPVQDFQIVSQEIEPVVHSLPEGVFFEQLPDIDLTQGIDLEAEYVPFSAQDVVDAGFVFAPYIPLYQTPTVHLSDLYGPKFYTGWKRKIYNIPKYDNIYSDIRERFEILGL